MRILLQRVQRAKCTIDETIIGQINNGYLLLIGVHENDTEEIADKMLEKIKNLRIFEDENGKTNLNAASVNGEALLVSQFTLYADCRKGNRPSFTGAANPAHAKQIYDYMISKSKSLFSKIQTGEFGADMQIELINDGPFTIYLDSETLFTKG